MDPSFSLPEQKRQRKRWRFILQIALSAALGGFLFGYDTAVINGAVGAIGEVFNISSHDLGRAVAAALLGSAVGALSAGWLVAVSSKTYLPVFAFVVGVASLGLFVFMVAPPRLVGGSDLAEPLLDGEAAAPVV